MTKIYDQHKAAFANVAAYVITDKRGDKVATIAFKYPRDGAGRLYAYVHWLGTDMVRGHASGCGYDKHSAALETATKKINMPTGPEHMAFQKASCSRFTAALSIDNGKYWNDRLRDAGFNVLSAV